jgi:transcriptional regulator GlxA family with amidase domain
MKRISILVPRRGILANIEGSRQVFAMANEFCEMQGKPSPFEIRLVGLTPETKLNRGLYTITADYTINNTTPADLIIIPAMTGDLKEALTRNSEYIPWLASRYNEGSEIASLCVGAFLLASTGLLDGKNCATHWIASNEFRRMFPDVNLVTDQIITDGNGLYTSGGAYSSMNLILYLVEKYAGRETALFCAKVFQIDIDRGTQTQFMIFSGQKEHDDETIRNIQEYIENNYRDKITIDKLAGMFALSRRNLERRFKKATSNTITEYIQRVKVEAAKMSLESSRENVSEVMYKSGYADTKAFRLTFKRITGLSPLQYRNKYNREAEA